MGTTAGIHSFTSFLNSQVNDETLVMEAEATFGMLAPFTRVWLRFYQMSECALTEIRRAYRNLAEKASVSMRMGFQNHGSILSGTVLLGNSHLGLHVSCNPEGVETN